MVGNQLRLTREALGLTIDAMAGRVGVSRSHLSRVERDLRPPTDELLAAIDKEAITHGISSSVLEGLLIRDPAVLSLARFLLDPDISDARKAAVCRMMHILIRSE